MPQPIQKRIPILLGVKANEKNAALVAELCDGWECGPDDSKSVEKLREGAQIYRQAFVKAGRNPADLKVRAILPMLLTDDGQADARKIFSRVPDMQAAGVTEFATGVTGRLGGPFSSMAAIERFINGVAAMAAKH
jgi:alkanesulfonate monooxygenase SsuD/methylene tetrahydromethanopterin reductase-like flavin-dependent oxidoreductase (luciferase family)